MARHVDEHGCTHVTNLDRGDRVMVDQVEREVLSVETVDRWRRRVLFKDHLHPMVVPVAFPFKVVQNGATDA